MGGNLSMKRYIIVMISGILLTGWIFADTVAYWRFEEGPAGSSVKKPFGAIDSSGNGNHLEPWTEAGSNGFRYRSDVAFTSVPGTGAANN